MADLDITIDHDAVGRAYDEWLDEVAFGGPEPATDRDGLAVVEPEPDDPDDE